MFYRNLFNASLLILCLVLFLVLLAGGAWAGDSLKTSEQNNPILRDENGKRYITAVRTKTPVKVDGLLNDPAWQNARFQGQFTQREPEEGAPA